MLITLFSLPKGSREQPGPVLQPVLTHYSVTRCSAVDQRRALSGELRFLSGDLLLLAP